MRLSRTDILLDKVQFKYLFLAVYLLGTSLHGMPSSQVLAEEVRENDSVIEKRILKELREDPFIKSHGIKVSVKDGIATLTGSIENRTEHAAATANAFQCGAKEVRNLLKIKKDPVIPGQKDDINDTTKEHK